MAERIWRAPGRRYVRLLPEALGIAQRGLSGALAAAVCDFGLEESYRLAALRLRVHYGFELGAERIRQATQRHCQQLSAPLAKRGRVCRLPAAGAEAIITQCDGSMLCTVSTGASGDARRQRTLEWKEARLCAAQAQGEVSIHYEGGLLDAHGTGILWGHAAAAAGWGIGSHVQAMGDGAEWIQQQAKICFADAPFVLDFYHVLDYLWPAAETCAGRPGAKRWCQRQKNRLRAGQSDALIAELGDKAEPASVADENAPVRRAYRYLHARRDQLDYPAALRRDLPVGTGMIESAHKHIIQKRLKGPGMAWLPANAHAMIQARAKRASEMLASN